MRESSAAAPSVRSDDPERPRIAVFVRPVEPGQVKTRLIGELQPREAAALYAAFVHDTLTMCRSLPDCDVELWVAGDPEHPTVQQHGLACIAQPQADLGTRMTQAIAHGNGRPTLVIGSDAPTLPGWLLRAGLDGLGRGADIVLGPATDGGFTLIGGHAGRLPDLSHSIRWSDAQTLGDTLAAIARAQLSVELLSPWYDVDTAADLRMLALHLTLDSAAARASAAALATLGRGPEGVGADR